MSVKPQHGDRRNCRACGTPLVFIRDIEGTLHPLDAQAPTYRIEPDAFGVEVAVRADALVSHFATCSKAEQFSGGQKKKSP